MTTRNITVLATNYSSREQATKAAERQAKVLTARGYPTRAIEPTEVKYNTQERRQSFYVGVVFAVCHHTAWRATLQDL